MPAPRPTPKNSQVVVRLSDEALQDIDQYAAQEQRTRSDVIRMLLDEARAARKRRRTR